MVECRGNKLYCDLIDKIQAATYLQVNIHIALEDLKAMNKKSAFTVGQNEPRKMGLIEGFKSLNATIVSVNF
jgi:hypothetical protein